MARRLYRLAPLCCAALIAVASPPRAPAATRTWSWGPLDGEGYTYAADGTATPFAVAGATLSITYDPATAPSGASLTVSPGDAPDGVPATTFRTLAWSAMTGEPLEVDGIAIDGTQVQVIFDGHYTGSFGFTGWPESLDTVIGAPVEVGVWKSAYDLEYNYGLIGPPPVVPEPSGLVLLMVGVGGVMVIAWSRSTLRADPAASIASCRPISGEPSPR